MRLQDVAGILICALIVFVLGSCLYQCGQEFTATVKRQTEESRACRKACQPNWGEIRYAGSDRVCYCDRQKFKPEVSR